MTVDRDGRGDAGFVFFGLFLRKCLCFWEVGVPSVTFFYLVLGPRAAKGRGRGGSFGLKNGQTARGPGGCFGCRVFISRHVGIVAFASKARSKPPCPRVIGLCELWPLAWKFAWRELKTLQRRVAQLFDGSILHFPPLHAGGEEPLTDVRSQPPYFRRQPGALLSFYP